MTKTELEKKHLSDLHLLASEVGIEKYRLLTKSELIDRLAGENGDGAEAPAQNEERPRRRRSRRTSSPSVADEPEADREEQPREPRQRPEKAPEREPSPEPLAREERAESTQQPAESS